MTTTRAKSAKATAPKKQKEVTHMEEQKKQITIKDFISIWQTSSSVDEVCTRTGYSKNYACARAVLVRKALRKHGGDLQSFKGGPRHDYAGLAAFSQTFVETAE